MAWVWVGWIMFDSKMLIHPLQLYILNGTSLTDDLHFQTHGVSLYYKKYMSVYKHLLSVLRNCKHCDSLCPGDNADSHRSCLFLAIWE